MEEDLTNLPLAGLTSGLLRSRALILLLMLDVGRHGGMRGRSASVLSNIRGSKLSSF